MGLASSPTLPAPQQGSPVSAGTPLVGQRPTKEHTNSGLKSCNSMLSRLLPYVSTTSWHCWAMDAGSFAHILSNSSMISS